MLIIYEKCLFHLNKNNKLGMRTNPNDVKFLKYIGEDSVKNIRKDYEKMYPTDSIREFGVGQGVPVFMMDDVRREKEHKIVLYIMNREENINELLD